MAIDLGLFSCAGQMRIRAKALDPYAGLRGRAYIVARQLDQNPLERLDAKATAEAKSESRKNLMNAINQRPLAADANSNVAFASGEMDALKQTRGQRLFVVTSRKAMP